MYTQHCPSETRDDTAAVYTLNSDVTKETAIEVCRLNSGVLYCAYEALSNRLFRGCFYLSGLTKVREI